MASEARRSEIDALEKEVLALAPLAANPDEKARSRYDQALAELRQRVEEK